MERWFPTAIFPRMLDLKKAKEKPPHWGLSPHVRGNPTAMRRGRLTTGSIPACAGEPRCPSPSTTPRRVYPRMCGGTVAIGVFAVAAQGLSPHVRGNLRDATALRRREGSIPACAGEPASCRGVMSSVRVYPRMCGGTLTPSNACADPWGLSPHVQGNRSRGRLRATATRSIPACAGEPTWRISASPIPRVYPRMCGGTRPERTGRSAHRGLSPHVRGNRKRQRGEAIPPRSIPACAGEPSVVASGNPGARVYPRMCGGTGPGGLGWQFAAGLSPHVRGNLCPATY